MGSPGARKNALRAHYRDLRMRLDQAQKVELDRRICERVQRLLSGKRGIWTTYISVRNEVDAQALVKNTQAQIQWAYPRVENNTMEFLIPSSEGDFVEGAFGILEPDPKTSKRVQAKDIEGCLIPGVAFDHDGHRLGSGKGFYDRFLENFSGLKVGLAYAFQVSEKPLPTEANDVPVHVIVTENETLTIA